MSQAFDLKEHDIAVTNIGRNLPAARLYEEAIRFDPSASIADSGALVAYSGTKTGRSPKDKHVVKAPATEHDIWWGSVNIPIEKRSFDNKR